jgi:hypothetical protein
MLTPSTSTGYAGRNLPRAFRLALVCFAGLAASCERPSGDTRPAGEDGWLRGDAHQKFGTLADQLGGIDRTMMEMSYRYAELYFAGEAENWEYAAHHLEEMEGTLKLGLQRRPKRAASAKQFLEVALPLMNEAVALRDAALFRERFADLTANCNACHAMEEVTFILIDTPTHRAWPWPMKHGVNGGSAGGEP